MATSDNSQATIAVRTETRDRMKTLKRHESAARDEDVTYDDLLLRLADTHERVAELAGLYDI